MVTTTLKSLAGYMILVSIAIATAGCSDKARNSSDAEFDDEDTFTHAPVQYFDFDQVKDLSSFFDSIYNEHGVPLWEPSESESFVQGLSGCIGQIEDYRQGRSEEYPATQIRSCIESLGHECAIVGNHNPEADLTYPEWFVMLAAFYSPELAPLVQEQTPDSRAGVLNFKSEHYSVPSWPFLFLKREKGYEVRLIGQTDMTITDIYQLTDQHDNLYYLCSNHSEGLSFLQVLYWVRSQDDVVFVAECDDYPPFKGDDKYHFNLERKVWYRSYQDEKTKEEICDPDDPFLILELDKDDSAFVKRNWE